MLIEGDRSDDMFQSTPVIANGRIFTGTTGMLDALWFQSTPVIANGRIPNGKAPKTWEITVSIHARYC